VRNLKLAKRAERSRGIRWHFSGNLTVPSKPALRPCREIRTETGAVTRIPKKSSKAARIGSTETKAAACRGDRVAL
jgi:hypothetical protein